MSAKKPGTYYARNRKRSLAQVKAYRAAHREDLLRKAKEYRERNREKLAAEARRRRLENPEQCRARDRARREQHAERDNSRNAARRLKDPAPDMLRSARTRAVRAALPFTLTLGDVQALYAGGQCECCGAFVRASRRTAAGGPTKHAATLDRVIPTLGYVPGNVALLCWTCNRRKSDSTLEQLEQLTAWIRGRLS